MQVDQKINWAILVTGWGRNAKDTIEAYAENKIKRSNIKLLIFEQEPCGAKEAAEKHNIETLCLVKKDYADLKTYQDKIIFELKSRKIDYVFMLNYKYIIKEEMLNAFHNRIINIHPSLFPSFLGTKTAIQDAINYGVKISGITTHIIDEKLDHGTILCQTAINIPEESDFETIYPEFAKEGKKIVLDTIQKIEEMHFGKG